MNNYPTRGLPRTRAATLPDVEQIHALIQSYVDPEASEVTLLPRTIPELCENVRDFVVAEEGGRVVGCGALHLYGMHLAEIRSIALLPEIKGRGVGRALVNALLQEAKRQSVSCVCLFTRTPEFFARCGFQVAQREMLPDKIYKDCVSCPKLNDCTETAMVLGKIPTNSNGLRDPQILIPLVKLRVSNRS